MNEWLKFVIIQAVQAVAGIRVPCYIIIYDIIMRRYGLNLKLYLITIQI